PAPKMTTYLVTLANADKPGLSLAPPPKTPKASATQLDDPTATAPTAAEDPTLARDLVLTETERILLDYIDEYNKVAAR
ncbi:MAG TPA: hypothetical protein VKT77_09555, partial [Chthonomonadaceae bacterium]|nr:hypothetical protein [Chthonomonadaceae bacterium]